MAKHRRNISKRTRLAVYARDNWMCQYCGLQFDRSKTWNPESIAPYLEDESRGYIFLELDHVHPLHHGGTNTEDNLRCACSRCNRRKSFKVLEVVS